MPILNADEAQQIVFMKRSMRPGFAGIENELLFDPKTTLLFGDAKDSLGKLLKAVKSALMTGHDPSDSSVGCVLGTPGTRRAQARCRGTGSTMHRHAGGPDDGNANDQMTRPDGHRYEAPESRGRAVQELGLRRSWASCVVGLMLLVATGVVPIFDF